MKKAVILITVIVLMLTGCVSADGTKEYSTEIFAMDTYMSVRFYGSDGEAAIKELRSEIRRLEGLLSVNDDNSDIAAVNRAEGSPVNVSGDTAALVESSLGLSARTDGALDITVCPVLREWGFTTDSRRIPDRQRLSELLRSVDYRRVTVDSAAGTITVPKGFMLDCGAVAKGYLGDRLCSILRERGIGSALLDLGGNIQTIGCRQDGSLWRVGIKDPADASRTVCTISVRDKAVITSGSYERFFVGDDGKKYWHIIDPQTGFPADKGLCSVTVIGESGVECDGLSTALFVMGRDKAAEYCREHTGTDAVLIGNDGHIFITAGIAGNTEFRDGIEYTVISSQEEE